MAPTKRPGKKAAAGKANAGATAGNAGFAKADWADSFKKKGAGVSDMTLLSTISNESINDNLKKRFENREIYTYIGHVLISVNPFQTLPIYTIDVLRSYKGKNRLEMAPHVYAIAESMYYNMNAYEMNQCVIISGESGAGKTEAAKKIMEYIADVSGESSESSVASGISAIKDMVLATNPLLEAFGCAKTLRNNNSSRHGKYLEIEFGKSGEPVGAMITNYLLEKGRIVRQIEDERNFHIFYQFTKNASPEQRETFGIQTPASYFYTSRANCLDVPGIDDGVGWSETLEAMNTIGITSEEQTSVLRMLAVVLWLGNAQYRENAEGNSEVNDDSVSAFVAYLLEVDQASVVRCLTTRTVETQKGMRRGSVYEVPMNKVQAEAARDALAKAVYNNLFDWIVDRINISMKARAPAATIIGVLDIYGFEIFESNSFEQLCINYVNERLQQIFIELTLKKEQEEYEFEQISWTPIKFFNNKIVCDLIDEKRPPGIFAAMNDATATAHADSGAADNSFMQRMGMLSSNPHFEPRGSKFLVKHYAGDVMYDVVGMTDKNKDALGKDLLDLVASSANPFVRAIFPDRIDPNSKKRPPTQGDKIKVSANALVEKLMRSQPSYIRTIKPNQNKSPSEYDSPAILHQIKYLGLQENIRIRRAGFAYRNTFEAVVGRFYLLSRATGYAGNYIWSGDYKDGCERIFKDVGIAPAEWQLGVTKAFIKNPETLFALEHMRDRYWHNMAARIQRAWRNYVRHKNECAAKIQRFWRSKKDNIVYVQLRDYGHQVYAGRKERRRFSLLGARQFFGDYLDVRKGQSTTCEMLRHTAGITSNEQVAFSSRGFILISKLGRSSKPSPRFFIVSDKALYILVTQMGPQGTETSLERRINLVTISSVGLTNLRDDWMAINVSNTEEPDPVISCLFKTELLVHMLQRSGATMNVNISPTITYRKKKDKMASIKAQKDETVKRDDLYKSHTIHVPSGEPANSVSKPMPPRKPGPPKVNGASKSNKPAGANKPVPQSRPIPQTRPLPGKSAGPPPLASNVPRAPPRPTASTSTTPRAPIPPPAPAAPKAVAAPSVTRAPPKREPVAQPPPPPPPPAAPAVEQWKVKYDFLTTESGEMALQENELVQVLQQSDNGWWLVKKNNSEGWAPAQYLEKAKSVAAPVRRAPPIAPPMGAPTTSNSSTRSNPVSIGMGSRSGESSAQPIAVMPGMGNANGGLAAILAAKRAASGGGEESPSAPASGRSTPTSSRGPAPAPKPKPSVGSKPAAPAPPARPGAPAQFDLAAALAKRAGRMQS